MKMKRIVTSILMGTLVIVAAVASIQVETPPGTEATPTPTKTFVLPDMSKEQEGQLAVAVKGVTTQDGRNMSVLYGTVLERIAISGGVHYEWLIVARHNAKSPSAKGFEASYTTVTSAFKPIVAKHVDGTWVIHFVSEIAEREP